LPSVVNGFLLGLAAAVLGALPTVMQIMGTPAMSQVQAEAVLVDLGLHFVSNWLIWGIAATCLIAAYRRSTVLFWGLLLLVVAAFAVAAVALGVFS
jgi:hypothetical protein